MKALLPSMRRAPPGPPSPQGEALRARRSPFFLVTHVPHGVRLGRERQQWQRSPFFLVTYVYLVFAVRRLYGESWPRTLGKAALLRIGLFAAEALALAIALGRAMPGAGIKW